MRQNALFAAILTLASSVAGAQDFGVIASAGTLNTQGETTFVPGQPVAATSTVYGYGNQVSPVVSITTTASAKAEMGRLHITSGGGFVYDGATGASATNAGSASAQWFDLWTLSGSGLPQQSVEVQVSGTVHYSFVAGGAYSGVLAGGSVYGNGYLQILNQFWSLADLRDAAQAQPSSGTGYGAEIQWTTTLTMSPGAATFAYGVFSYSGQTGFLDFPYCPSVGSCQGDLMLNASNTASIDSIIVPDGYVLASASGALRNVNGQYEYLAAPVPEPETAWMLALGLTVLSGICARRSRTSRRDCLLSSAESA